VHAASSPRADFRPLRELTVHERADLVPDMTREEYEGLLADIRERGLVTPVDVTAKGVVLDGRHRLRAAGDLALLEVPVRVVTPSDELEHMVLAALQRRHLSASQKAALALELADYRQAREEARRRRQAGARAAVATLPQARERSREVGARLVGVSPRTLQDAATVKAADPELFAAIKAGTVAAHRAAKRVRRERKLAALPSSPPLPTGLFQILYADPPWRSEAPGSEWSPEQHYPTMSVAEIQALDVPAADDALLFLWAVSGRLPEALVVMAAWGFEYKTCLVWVKHSIGLGRWVRHRHELLLLGRRGEFPLPEQPDRPDSVIEARRGRHSEKPTRVYELIERMYPTASRVELFARTERPGWTAWGNEVAA
jgi:N6-adenosine-specific RNA methylase IME4